MQSCNSNSNFVSAFQSISNYQISKSILKSGIRTSNTMRTGTDNACRTSSSLDMKVTINIDVDLPDFKNFEIGNFNSLQDSLQDLISNASGNVIGSGVSGTDTDTGIVNVSSLLDSISSLTSITMPMTGTTHVASNYNNLFTDSMNMNTLNMNTLNNMGVEPSTLGLGLGLPDIISNILLLAFTTTFTISAFTYALSFPKDNFRENYEPYTRGNYDPQVAREYYAKHPLLVARRFLQLLRIANKWIFYWLYERFVLKPLEKNEFLSTIMNRNGSKNNDAEKKKKEKQQKERAEELLLIIQKVGPTAIKVGQALSVRPDLIPEVYTKTLSELQDNVPPFNSEQAKDLLLQELGYEKFQKLKDIDLDNPVASASIGQVYKGVVELNDEYGNVNEKVEVAVKVQRPNVLSEIALDLFLAREIAPYYQKLTMNDTNLQSLADEWGRGFIAELTYELEAKNTIRFNEEMKNKNMNAVCAPTVVESLCTNRILTTEWVNGVRLDRSEEEDVARLCGVALNAYLVMLLETGTLHCGKFIIVLFLCLLDDIIILI
jgi:hypothetical protein